VMTRWGRSRAPSAARNHAVRRIQMPLTRLGSVALVCLITVGCVAAGSGSGNSETPASSGLDVDSAIAIARSHVPADARFIRAAHGLFSVVVDSPRSGPAYPVAPDRLVWVVTFESAFTICPPDGSPCWSPRPGSTTVILDFNTGDFLAAPAFAPAPG
jgi:hypothetical protein